MATVGDGALGPGSLPVKQPGENQWRQRRLAYWSMLHRKHRCAVRTNIPEMPLDIPWTSGSWGLLAMCVHLQGVNGRDTGGKNVVLLRTESPILDPTVSRKSSRCLSARIKRMFLSGKPH